MSMEDNIKEALQQVVKSSWSCRFCEILRDLHSRNCQNKLLEKVANDTRVNALLKSQANQFVIEESIKFSKNILCRYRNILMQNSVDSYDLESNLIENSNNLLSDMIEAFNKNEDKLIDIELDLIFSIIKKNDISSDSVGFNNITINGFLNEDLSIIESVMNLRGITTKVSR